jgi:hypothetical protein
MTLIIFSRTLEARLKTFSSFLAHTARVAEQGDTGVSCTVLCAPLPCFLDMTVTQRAVALNGDAIAIAPRTSVTPGIRTLRPDAGRTECVAHETVQPFPAKSPRRPPSLDEHDQEPRGLVLAFA